MTFTFSWLLRGGGLVDCGIFRVFVGQNREAKERDDRRTLVDAGVIERELHNNSCSFFLGMENCVFKTMGVCINTCEDICVHIA
jgi:hypothetical protein